MSVSVYDCMSTIHKSVSMNTGCRRNTSASCRLKGYTLLCCADARRVLEPKRVCTTRLAAPKSTKAQDIFQYIQSMHAERHKQTKTRRLQPTQQSKAKQKRSSKAPALQTSLKARLAEKGFYKPSVKSPKYSAPRLPGSA